MGKVGAGETALVAVNAGVMAGVMAGIPEEASACSSDSSANESRGGVDTSEGLDTSGVPDINRGVVAGSVTVAEPSAECSSWAELAGFFSASDFRVVAKVPGVPAAMASSGPERDALSRFDVAVTVCGVIGSSDILFFETLGFVSKGRAAKVVPSFEREGFIRADHWVHSRFTHCHRHFFRYVAVRYAHRCFFGSPAAPGR